MLNFNDFLGYMAHEQEIEDIINRALEEIDDDDEEVEIELPYYLSDSEIEYIKERLRG